MNIISSESIDRINFDKWCDSIPLIGTVNNLVDIAQKIISRNQEPSEKTRYYRYLDAKSFSRCVTLCIPILGSLAVRLYDFIKEKQMQTLMRTKQFEKAAELGSVDAMLYLARQYETTTDSGCQEQALDLYRKAADKGDLKGLFNVVGWSDDSYYLTTFKENKEGLRDLLLKQGNCESIHDLFSKFYYAFRDDWRGFADKKPFRDSLLNLDDCESIKPILREIYFLLFGEWGDLPDFESNSYQRKKDCEKILRIWNVIDNGQLNNMFEEFPPLENMSEKFPVLVEEFLVLMIKNVKSVLAKLISQPILIEK